MIAPLAQTVMLNINPKERIGQAMAIYGMGIMVAPIIGPTLGGWLTESFDWRWVFLINLPVGIATVAMLLLYMPETGIKIRRFDFFGFGMLGLGVGALQLLLDRGADNDWFSSTETWIELGLVITGFWVFITHSLTAKTPFIDLRIFKDLNFAMASLIMFIVGITLFSGLALLPPLLQNLMGYPVIFSSVIMAPARRRDDGAMMIVGRMTGKVDPRLMMLFGIGLMSYSLYLMTGFSPADGLYAGDRHRHDPGVRHGLHLRAAVDAGLRHHRAHVPGGRHLDVRWCATWARASASSVVTAVLSHMIGVNHIEVGERLTATSWAVLNQLPILLTGNKEYLDLIDQFVQQQGSILSYLDDFVLMMWLSIAVAPIICCCAATGRRPPPGLLPSPRGSWRSSGRTPWPNSGSPSTSKSRLRPLRRSPYSGGRLSVCRPCGARQPAAAEDRRINAGATLSPRRALIFLRVAS